MNLFFWYLFTYHKSRDKRLTYIFIKLLIKILMRYSVLISTYFKPLKVRNLNYLPRLALNVELSTIEPQLFKFDGKF
jgi:hypothetical protein